MRTTLAIALAIIILVAGCASNTGSSRGTEVKIRYAEISRVERVPLPSAAPAGAIVGGFTGLVLSQRQSGGRQLASGIAGAALGGLATKALEGERRGYAYRLRFLDGNESDFITEKGYLRAGDCVAVESGNFQNIRRVASTVCEATPNLRVAAHKLHSESAAQCAQAKQQLLIAQGTDEINSAVTKVEIICHF